MTINLTFWLILALLASIIGNIFAFWYIRVVLTKLMFVGENLADLVDLIDTYKKHLKGVYEMEMFYGDETLEFLMQHTRSLRELLDQYSDIYSIIEPQEDIDTLIEEETEDNEKKTITEENVFYAGSRKSNT
jgi:hypothetical protein